MPLTSYNKLYGKDKVLERKNTSTSTFRSEECVQMEMLLVLTRKTVDILLHKKKVKDALKKEGSAS